MYNTFFMLNYFINVLLNFAGLSRKHRKRLLAKSRAGLSIVEDVKSVEEPVEATVSCIQQ